MEVKKLKITETSRSSYFWTYHIINESGEVLARFDSSVDDGPWPEDVKDILTQMGYTVTID